MGKKKIAEQNGRLVAPFGVDRCRMAPDHRFIEDIVVYERGCVDHLDHGRQYGMGRGEGATGLTGKQDERRSQSFAAIVGTMIDELLHDGNRLPSSSWKIRSASSSCAAMGTYIDDRLRRLSPMPTDGCNDIHPSHRLLRTNDDQSAAPVATAWGHSPEPRSPRR